MRKVLRESIIRKIDMILRQYNISGNMKVYAPILLELKEKLFSGDHELEQEALKGMKSLLLTIRAWDGYDYSKNPDDFIDDFNDFEELYSFLEDFIKDVERYVKSEKGDVSL